MKLFSKPILIPAVLLVYLAVMSYIGYGDYAAGRSSALYYYSVIIITLAIIIALYFFLCKRERLRREREEDMKRNQESKI